MTPPAPEPAPAAKRAFPWVGGKFYVAGDVVAVDGQNYIATSAHDSRDLYRPGAGSQWQAAWRVYEGTVEYTHPWRLSAEYSAGDEVLYEGRLFTARIAHEANPSNRPGRSTDHWRETNF